MLGNTFGTFFRVATFGESHGPAMGVVVDGCPAGFAIDIEFIQNELKRRRPGQSKLVSQRKETDSFEILSGLFEGKTTGAPLAFVVFNQDVKSKDYEEIKELFRPGHADFTYFGKFGHRDYRGGGRSSARETVARVIAGAIAKQLLALVGVRIKGGVLQIGKAKAKTFAWEQVERSEVRSLDPEVESAFIAEIEAARKERDSIGGIVEVWAEGVPLGLGEPVFGRLDAAIAAAIMSIPAVKGIEIGAGFSAAALRGSEMNDEMTEHGFLSNNHGGILGGISSGAPIVVRFVVKPTASIAREQQTIDVNFQPAKISTRGRHDPCIAIRAVPVAESMLALVLVDAWLQFLASKGIRETFMTINNFSYGLSPDKSRANTNSDPR
ncbi:MAG: chorismate synthase [Deltaproteobacteria bacterium]|nr:chorismate synthase [Deltaproteobacteria bacterium]